jgi:hypothetical protein
VKPRKELTTNASYLISHRLYKFQTVHFIETHRSASLPARSVQGGHVVPAVQTEQTMTQLRLPWNCGERFEQDDIERTAHEENIGTNGESCRVMAKEDLR